MRDSAPAIASSISCNLLLRSCTSFSTPFLCDSSSLVDVLDNMEDDASDRAVFCLVLFAPDASTLSLHSLLAVCEESRAEARFGIDVALAALLLLLKAFLVVVTGLSVSFPLSERHCVLNC